VHAKHGAVDGHRPPLDELLEAAQQLQHVCGDEFDDDDDNNNDDALVVVMARRGNAWRPNVPGGARLTAARGRRVEKSARPG
jgi:hypothetical protein